MATTQHHQSTADKWTDHHHAQAPDKLGTSMMECKAGNIELTSTGVGFVKCAYIARSDGLRTSLACSLLLTDCAADDTHRGDELEP
jgi:hypothetical protein